MEQQSRCTFRGPPSTVNASDHQDQEDRLVDDGWHLLNQSAVQAGVQIFPHGGAIELDGLSTCLEN